MTLQVPQIVLIDLLALLLIYKIIILCAQNCVSELILFFQSFVLRAVEIWAHDWIFISSFVVLSINFVFHNLTHLFLNHFVDNPFLGILLINLRTAIWFWITALRLFYGTFFSFLLIKVVHFLVLVLITRHLIQYQWILPGKGHETA